mgnify:CR=1 FL=1
MIHSFDELLSEVLQGKSESAVVDNYFLIHYPYLQGHTSSAPHISGEVARFYLLRRFSGNLAEAPGKKGEKVVRVLKKKPGVTNPFALTRWLRNRKRNRSPKD